MRYRLAAVKFSERPPIRRRRRLVAYLGTCAIGLVTLAPRWVRADSTPDPSADAAADTPVDTSGYEERPDVISFIDEMVAKHGFVRDALLAIFSQASHNDTVARLMGPVAAAAPTPWSAYEARFVEPARIDAGVRFWQANSGDLQRAAQTYGVPPEVLVGILGVETFFGRNTGKFRVLDALTTLAFDYPDPAHDRSAFFREQLENFLVMTRDRSDDVLEIRGSYAGAIGLAQFMPESILKYAVDFDGDGSIDLRNSASDAIGSIANYLAAHGWVSGLPIYYRSQLVAANPDGLIIGRLVAAGSEPSLTPADLRQAGFVFIDDVPADTFVALIDFPDGTNPTRYVLGTRNFFVLTRYNRSYAYVMAVVELGVAIATQLHNTPSDAALGRENPG